ncbi:MAG TPA: cysteine--tRNA ligase, partial [Solirubrobacteraceae bacterium]|nr:cysteine--tRNA ligase [Solirubrobacteraceae bacterium]
MTAIRLQDTRSGELRELVPRADGHVGIYACGPTVYSRIHVGNARPFVVFSLLKRFLEHEGLNVTLVINVTDVNDKIYDAARPLGVSSVDLAEEMTAHYRADTDALGLGRPDAEPLASETIEPIVALISDLIDAGHAYAVDGDVYFRVRSDPDYGSLSRRAIDEMNQGEGERLSPVGESLKEDPLDFALWKAHKEGEDSVWYAPWGRGRPGWHIECSAMSEALLGETIDIHGGGHDLVFPHHENERAQSTCAHGGKVFARYWLHNGFVTVNHEKMAKSVGNVLLLRELLKDLPGEAIRMALLSGHYRQPLDWNDEVAADARRKLDRLYGALRALQAVEPAAGVTAPAAFMAALEDDLNTPMALAVLFELAHGANTATDDAERARIKAELIDAGALLGLLQQAPESWFEWSPAGTGLDPAEIDRQLALRAAARAAK